VGRRVGPCEGRPGCWARWCWLWWPSRPRPGPRRGCVPGTKRRAGRPPGRRPARSCARPGPGGPRRRRGPRHLRRRRPRRGSPAPTGPRDGVGRRGSGHWRRARRTRPARPPAAGVDAQDPDDARGPRTAGPRRRRRRRAGGRAGRRQPRRDRARRQLHGPAAPFRASAEFRQRHRERPGPHPRRRPGSARGDAGQGVHTGRARHPSRLRVRARRAGDVDVRVRPGRPVPGRAAGPDHPRAGRDEERAVPRGDGATSTRTTGERDSRHRKRRLARLERATRGAEIPTREGKTRARLSGGEGGGAVSGGG
jgi:hypothetical protein